LLVLISSAKVKHFSKSKKKITYFLFEKVNLLYRLVFEPKIINDRRCN